jgi:hypothetical protein
VMTYSGGTLSSGVTIYLNGATTSLSVTSDATPNTQNTPYYIGLGHAATDFGYFGGYIDDVAFFDRALTANEVAGIYSGTLSSFYAQIKNTDTLNLRKGSSTSAAILKTLPGDLVVYVTSTANASGTPFTLNI